MLRLVIYLSFLGSSSLFLSCGSNSERLIIILNDSHSKWERISCIDYGITTTCNYKADSFNIRKHSTRQIRSRKIDNRKLLYNWHFPSEKEMENFGKLLSDEFKDVDILRLMKASKKDSLLIAYILNEDKSPISDQNYDFSTWIDVFTFHINTDELVHYSYGKF